MDEHTLHEDIWHTDEVVSHTEESRAAKEKKIHEWQITKLQSSATDAKKQLSDLGWTSHFSFFFFSITHENDH